ncbi:MAG: FAD binding domain-containing protein, partial [Pseudomonadota bacterium]
MNGFELVRPSTVADAIAALAHEEAAAIAGGQTLIPTMKQRLAAPERLVDLSGIADLSGIVVQDDAIGIGAMSTHAEVAAHAGIQSALPMLAALAGNIGDPQVRHRGTIGGSVANN